MYSNAKSGSTQETTNQLAAGQYSAEQLVKHYLEAIEESDATLRAWVTVNAELVKKQAQQLDERRREGRSLGALHGIPIGLKDIIDTADIPTQRGTTIYEGRQPDSPAAVVEKLHEAGAIVLGKTVTTELAWMHQSETRNAINPEYSPGGSSSGSAAAVAAGQVPLAIGTQTGGSVIRPASYNGVFGFKPSRGLISRRGVLQTSPSLDQLGVFGHDVGDLALLVDALSGYDAADSATFLAPKPQLYKGYVAEVPVEPIFAWIDMPYQNRYSPDLNDGIDELCAAINEDTQGTVERIPAPQSFSALPTCHQVIYDVEILQSLNSEWNNHREMLSASAIEGLERAETRSKAEYQEALEIKTAAEEWFKTFFHDYDGILTPSAPGVAPLFGQGTGDPICCVVWTLCGLPCLSMPLLNGENDMPLGIQLVGDFDRDDRLMRTARWLLDALNQPEEN